MTLPASFQKDGFLSPAQLRTGKLRRLMCGTDGPANSGKTEFALSAPGPGIVICLDRGLDGVLDNPRPPATRRDDYAFKVIPRAFDGQVNQNVHVDNWKMFYSEYCKALDNKDARTVVIDTDSDSWEMQRLAEFGKLTQVPSLRYPAINSNRKAMYSRAWDSGKIVFGLNRLTDEYQTQINKDGKDVQIKTGGMKRQGFNDWTFLWGLQLRHFVNARGEFGVRILMCKADTQLNGYELVGDDCNFQSLVSTVYPNIELKEWGY